MEANRTGQLPAPSPSREHDLLRLHVATLSLRSNDAVGDSLQGETLGSGPVDSSMLFRCVGEGTSSEHWIGLTGSWAEAASHDLLTQSRHEAEDRLSIHEGHICKPQFVLALHEGLEVLGLGIIFCQQQVAALTVMQIGFQ